MLTLIGDDSFLCSTNGQRARLRHMHYGCEVLHAVHTKVSHCERSGRHLNMTSERNIYGCRKLSQYFYETPRFRWERVETMLTPKGILYQLQHLLDIFPQCLPYHRQQVALNLPRGARAPVPEHCWPRP